MVRSLTVIIFLGALFLSNSVWALEVPERPAGYVHDQGGVMSAQARERLEGYLRQYEAQTTNQIVVAAFAGLEEESLEDFSIRLAEAWKVGQKGKDNGVILLIFKNERRLRIEVGYGLEGALPDAMAGQIIQTVMAPLFKEEKYEEGVFAGVAAIIQATRGEFRAPVNAGPGARRELTQEELMAARKSADAAVVFVLIIVIIVSIVDLFRYGRYRNGHKLYRDRYDFWEWWFRFALLLFLINILFRILFYSMLFSRGGYHGGRGGFGGFRGGGGSFGGGGASGGW